MIKLLIFLLGFFIISVASDLGRPEEYRLKITEWRYWVQVLLFAISATIFQYLGAMSVIIE